MNYFIYDRSGNKRALLQNTTSIQWNPKYWETGSAEIHTRPTDDNVKYLIPFNRVVCQERNEILFINYVERSTDDDMTIHGYMDNLDQRINTATVAITNVEAGLIKLVQDNVRGLDINVAKATGLTAEVTRTETTYQTLRTSFEAFCQAAKLGWREVVKDGKLNVLELYQGQTRNNIRFSDDLGNILSQKYTQDLSEAKNYAYVLGEDEGTNRKLVIIDQVATGDPRLELYVDARDLQSEYTDSEGNEQVYPQEKYEEMLRQRGLSKLEESCKEAATFECELNSEDSLAVLGQDYDLGDVVPIVSHLFGLVIFARVTGIKFVEETGVNTKVTLELNIESQEVLR